MRTLSILVMLLATMTIARAEETAPSRIDSITKSARDILPAMPSLPSVSLPSMPDLSLPDFSDATGRVMSEFNIFTQQVGDALPILEQMGYEVTVFKVTWGLPPKADQGRVTDHDRIPRLRPACWPDRRGEATVAPVLIVLSAVLQFSPRRGGTALRM